SDDGVIKRRIGPGQMLRCDRDDGRRPLISERVVNMKRYASMTGHIPEWWPRVVRNPDDVAGNQIEKGRHQQNSMSHSFQGVDNTRRYEHDPRPGRLLHPGNPGQAW